MIPEAGTREELKAAWFEAAAQPMLGEVYLWERQMEGDKECWEIVDFSKPALNRVHINVYVSSDGIHYVRSVRGSSVYLPDWAKCIQDGSVRYMGDKLPPISAVMREQ